MSNSSNPFSLYFWFIIFIGIIISTIIFIYFLIVPFLQSVQCHYVLNASADKDVNFNNSVVSSFATQYKQGYGSIASTGLNEIIIVLTIIVLGLFAIFLYLYVTAIRKPGT